MATARTAAMPAGVAVDGLARLCELAAHPVPTFVARAPDGRKLVVEQLSNDARPELSRDATSLLRLHHPNLVHVRKVAPGSDGLELVHDYVEGESLAELLKAAEASGQRVPLEVQIRVVVDVLNGLSALHGHSDEAKKALGLFHGHVTPANLLVGADGTTRLLHLLLPHRPQGAPGSDDESFRAPELAKGEGDARSDIFSVGVLLDRAVRGATPGDLLWGAPFADVARRAMLPEGAARFATAAQMAAEVRKIAKAKLASPASVAATVDGLARARIAARKQRWATAVGAAPPLPSPRIQVPSRPAGFSDEAPTVPRKATPELLRMSTPTGVPLSNEPPTTKTLTPVATLAPAAAPVPAPAVAHVPAPVPALAPPLPPPPPLKPAPPLTPAPVLVIGPPATNEGSEAAVELDLEPDEPPAAAETAVPALSPSLTPPSSMRLGRDRRKGIVFGVLGVAGLILIVAMIRVLARGAEEGTTTSAAPTPPAATAPAPEVPPTTAATSVPTETPTPAATPTSTAAVKPATVRRDPPPADTPRSVPPATPSTTGHARHAAPPAAPKPATTYDPLGI